jgi:dCTP deaminase
MSADTNKETAASPLANCAGFLTIENVIERLKENILWIGEDEKKITKEQKEEIEQQVRAQQGKNGVVVDLRLGSEYFLSSQKVPKKLDENDEYLTIRSGEFALLTTHEKLKIPNDVLAFISMRFTYSLKGLINISGFHVDPGYSGRIIYSVYNAGPNSIVLKYKERIFMVIFAKIGTKIIRDLRQNPDIPDIDHIEPKHISGLVGTPVSIQSLDKRVSKMENWLKVLGWVIPAVIAAIIGIFFGFFGPGTGGSGNGN